MLRTILVPLDGSSLAERALSYAGVLARASEAQLVLVSAALPPAETAQQVQADLDRVAGRLRNAGLTTKERLYFASAAEAIRDASREEHAELIVMSTHGRTGVGRLLFGSVADAVLRQAEVPVLLVPSACARDWPRDRAPRILVALDGSPLAEEILTPVGTLAAALGAELDLLSVVEQPIIIAEPDAYPPAYDPAAELAGARDYLEQIAVGAWAAGRTVTVHVEEGAANRVIVDYAREHEVDLIAMATHGRRGLARLLLGSVTTGVLQRAATPLLLVRPAPVREPTATPRATVLV